MANYICRTGLFVSFFILLISIPYTKQLQSSQVRTLLRIQNLLNYPHFLETWNTTTNFCNIEPTPTLTLVCYEDSITQLHIVGNPDTTISQLPDNFSMDSLVTALVKLPSLKVLTLASLGLWGTLPSKFTRLTSLEILNLTSNFLHGNIPPSIASLINLQTLILDSNNFTGKLPEGLGSLSALAVLNVKNNSLYGPLPRSLGILENLRVLVMSDNGFSGEVPDFGGLSNLQVLELENNVLDSRFPIVGDKVERILLRNNRFTFGIPVDVQSYYQLKHLDISSNRLVGPFPVSLLSLPSIAYLDISENKLTGMLSENLPCNDELKFVNFTANLLTGRLPRCLLSDPKKRVVLSGGNCLENGDGNDQKPISFCKNEALAVGILSHGHKRKQASKVILGFSIFGGVFGGIVLVSATSLIVKKFLAKREARKPLPRCLDGNGPTGYASKLLKDARYVTQAMRIGGLGLPAYRSFCLEELEEATNNFSSSSFMGEGSHGQMYRGKLGDGSYVAIRCLKLKRNSTQYFMPHIEMVSKLRHHHLASSLGHCFEYYLDDSSVSRVFLVFEYVPNGTLRSWISERRSRGKLTWPQRIAAVTGVAKGIQFLHTGIVPGIFSNNVKITDVLVDPNLAAKISNYNLPLLSDNMGRDNFQNFLSGSKESKSSRTKHQDKLDIYDFGVILLEVISGRRINSQNEVDVLNDQLQGSIMADDASRKSLVDPVVRNLCSGESVKTMIEICCRCLLRDPPERPSIEDVLWTLQFAAQVQDAWRGDSGQSSESSPLSPLRSSRLKLSIRS